MRSLAIFAAAALPEPAPPAARVKRILLIDDHPLIRTGLSAQLADCSDIEVCGEAGNVREARQLAATLRPDAAVLDLMLGDEDGLTLIRELRRLVPAMRIVVLSMLDPEQYAPRAHAAGAQVFVNKADGPEAIIAALRDPDGSPIPGLLAAMDATTPAEDAALPTSRLSDRELQVFKLVGLGRTTREIATALGVSPKTVDAHKEHIKLRLGLANAAQLTARAAQWSAERPFFGRD